MSQVSLYLEIKMDEKAKTTTTNKQTSSKKYNGLRPKIHLWQIPNQNWREKISNEVYLIRRDVISGLHEQDALVHCQQVDDRVRVSRHRDVKVSVGLGHVGGHFETDL